MSTSRSETESTDPRAELFELYQTEELTENQQSSHSSDFEDALASSTFTLCAVSSQKSTEAGRVKLEAYASKLKGRMVRSVEEGESSSPSSSFVREHRCSSSPLQSSVIDSLAAQMDERYETHEDSRSPADWRGKAEDKGFLKLSSFFYREPKREGNNEELDEMSSVGTSNPGTRKTDHPTEFEVEDGKEPEDNMEAVHRKRGRARKSSPEGQADPLEPTAKKLPALSPAKDVAESLGSYHPVKEYFCKQGDVYCCLLCGREMKSGKTFNWMRHLRAFHDDEYNAAATQLGYPKKETEACSEPVEKPPPQQPHEDAQPITSRSIVAMRYLTRFLTSTGLSANILANPYLRSLLSLIPTFAVPTVDSLQSWVDHEVSQMRKALKALLLSKGRVKLLSVSTECITCGIPPRQCTIVHAHFFDARTKQPRSLILDVVETPNEWAHKRAELALKSALKFYEIELTNDQLLRCVTQSGNSAALQLCSPFVYSWGSSEASSSALRNVPNFDDVEVHLNGGGSVRAAGALTEELEDDASSPTKMPVMAGAFEKQLPCCADALQRVMDDAFWKAESFHCLLKKVLGVLNKFGASPVATANLLRTTKGVKLLHPAAGSGISLMAALERFAEVYEQVSAECSSQGWECLSREEAGLLEPFLGVLLPFKSLCRRLLEESRPTISLVYSGFAMLLKYIQTEREKCSGPVRDLIVELLRSAKQRLSFTAVTGSHGGRDRIYLATTLLDRAVSWMLLEDERKAAEKALVCLARSAMENCGERLFPRVNSRAARVQNPFDFGCVDSAIVSQAECYSLAGDVEDEIGIYVKKYSKAQHLGENALEYWISNSEEFPLLSEVALCLLCVPSCCGLVGRRISQSRNYDESSFTDGLCRNSLGTIRAIIMFECNKIRGD